MIFVIAMNFALVACQFAFIKWTSIEVRHRIIQEVNTVVTEVACLVLPHAVDLDHVPDSLLLICET